MINRENWKLSKEYLEYRSRVDQICDGSLKIDQTHIRYILEWLQESPFSKAKDKRPTFPEYLQDSGSDGQERVFSEGYLKKILATSRRFFLWLYENKGGHHHLNNSWRSTLKVKRITNVPRTRETVTLEDIQKIAAVPVHSISDKRIQAAAIFLYLSGMRVGAFVSMPILAVDIQKRIVKQHPNLGVRTKNGKHATTYLLDLPELLSIVQKWDRLVRSVLPDHGYWFAPLSYENGNIDPKNLDCPKSRCSLVNRQLKLWQREHGLQEYSPHKFRHGHVHYGMNNSRNISDYKAVSMNVMHSSMEITDEFYSVLNDNELQNRIQNLGKQLEQAGTDEEILQKIRDLLQ